MNIEHLLPLIIKLKSKMAALESQQSNSFNSLRQAVYQQDSPEQKLNEEIKVEPLSEHQNDRDHMWKSKNNYQKVSPNNHIEGKKVDEFV